MSQDVCGNGQQQLPRISVVVPSYNQGPYLRQCLESVTKQGYPNLELIVMDGGSTDGSVEILEAMTSEISFWESKPDGGQTNALLQGFQKSTGDIQCWLNSDDLHEENTLFEVAEFFQTHPEVDAVFGDTRWVDKHGDVIKEQREIPFIRFLWLYTHNYIPGMSMFWRRTVYEQVGGLDPTFNLAMDADLFIRFADVGKLSHIPRIWSRMRFYPEQKNRRLREQSDQEDLRIRERYWGTREPAFLSVKRGVAKGVRLTWKLFAGKLTFPLGPRMHLLD